MNFNFNKYKWFRYDCCCCVEGMMLCCGTTVDVVGVVGGLLLLAGVIQIASGVYFMLTMPIFDIASNIWTGIVSGFAGAVLMYYGSTNQTRRRGYAVITLTLMTVVVNVINIVIIQVGENGAFLSKNKLEVISIRGKDLQLQIAIWLTTTASTFAILGAFAVAQYIFCSQLRPRIRKRSLIPDSQTGTLDSNRFFPPSRLVGTKASTTPIISSISSVIPLPDPTNNQTTAPWVYSPEDKLSSSLYPMGLEVHPDILESTRRPTRHSSFAGPRYARVVQRPQRAQSFATPRDPFSLHSDPFPRLHPVAVPELPRTFCQPRRVRRSSSLNTQRTVTATLSRKYRAFSLSRNDPQVIEVGSLLETNSDHSLANALTDPSFNSVTTNQQPIEQYKTVDLNEKVVNEGPIKEFFTRLNHHKGPAPLPPIPQNRKEHQTELDDKIKKCEELKEESEDDDETKDYCTCSESCEEKDTDFDNLSSASSSVNKMDDSVEKYNETTTASELSKDSNSSSQPGTPVYEIPKLPPMSSIKDASQNSNLIQVLKNSYIAKYKNSDNPNWKNLEQFFNFLLEKAQTKDLVTESSSSSMETSPKASPKIADLRNNHMTRQSNQYEKAHKEVTEDYATLLEKLPTKEVQRNKIVLRVPSFKNTGCQTEAYRPIRRRASCTQGAYTISPRYTAQSSSAAKRIPTFSTPKDIEVHTTGTNCSSSSGYSSPDGDSKGSTPIHSGPPSPGSAGVASTEKKHVNTNITIIEVNRCQEGRTSQTPPRPPKPLRLKYASNEPQSEILSGKSFTSSILSPIKQSLSSTHQSKYETATIAEDPRLNEAINPILVQNQALSQSIPRIVNVIHKKPPDMETTAGVHSYAMDDTVSPSVELIKMNPIPRLQHVQYLQYKSKDRSRSPSPTNITSAFGQTLMESSSTAAYLASLELLASHYRQQALANARQLQLQQILDQHHLPLEQRNNSHRNFSRMNLSVAETLEEVSNSSAEEENC